MRSIVAIVILAILSAAEALAQDSFADRFIRGAEIGARMRDQQLQGEALRAYYAQQAELIRAQTKMIEAEVKRLEEEAKQKAQANTAAEDLKRELQQQGALILEMFGRLHPDWKEQEPRMTKFALKLMPQGDTTALEYLEILYLLARSPLTPVERPTALTTPN